MHQTYLGPCFVLFLKKLRDFRVDFCNPNDNHGDTTETEQKKEVYVHPDTKKPDGENNARRVGDKDYLWVETLKDI